MKRNKDIPIASWNMISNKAQFDDHIIDVHKRKPNGTE
jgi:hypothetical protein